MDPHALNRPLQVLRVCLHLLMAALLALAAARAVREGLPDAPGVLAAAIVLGLVYAAGPLLPPVARSRAAAGAWLTALGAVWLVMLWLTPDGVWLAFPLFLLQLHLLPTRSGLSAVTLTTVLAIAGFCWHQGQITAAAVIGPALGAAVAVAVALGYQGLYAESEQRRRLIDELTTARSELAEAERTAGMLSERERLAREIHDTLAQGLSSIQLLLRAAERALPADPDTAGGHVQHAREQAKHNLDEARRFVHALTPLDLERDSLPAALERLCTESTHPAGPTVQFHLDGAPTPITAPYQVALLRIAQSGLANITAHALAGRADLTLSYMPDGIALDIVDDGIGFDPAAVPSTGSLTGGFGLAAMRARARALGGRLTIESAPGKGTALAVNFSYDDRPTAHEEATTP